VEEPPEYAIDLWSEEHIRQYFENGGLLRGLPVPTDDFTPSPASAGDKNQNGVHLKDESQLKREYPAVPEDEFHKWFPDQHSNISKTKCATPKMRLICFTNAGNEENVFTLEGLRAKRVETLLEWCRSHAIEVLAVQLPGRGKRRKEPFMQTIQQVAKEVLRVVGSKLVDVPYCVIGHSLGTWEAFEFLSRAREEGFAMPLQSFLSAFPAPNIPEQDRPWKQCRHMTGPEFMDEARGWDVNEVVFQPSMWELYSPMMRADFMLFDEYEFRRASDAPFDFPLTSFVGLADKRVKELMVQGWGKMTSQAFECNRIAGNHLWVMEKEPKIQWYQIIISHLKKLPLFN